MFLVIILGIPSKPAMQQLSLRAAYTVGWVRDCRPTNSLPDHKSH